MNKKLELTDSQISIVDSVLSKLAPNFEVWAFGSIVKGNAREFSDLDLVLIGDEPVLSRLLWEIDEAFDESMLPFQVDVIDWQGTSDNFKAIIRERYIVLKENNG